MCGSKAAEKRHLVEKRSEASRRVKDEAAQLNSSIERLHGVLEGRVSKAFQPPFHCASHMTQT